MLQENESGLDFSFDLNNLDSLAVLTLFLEEGLQNNLKISLDSRLSYKFLKRLTGGSQHMLTLIDHCFYYFKQ